MPDGLIIKVLKFLVFMLAKKSDKFFKKGYLDFCLRLQYENFNHKPPECGH